MATQTPTRSEPDAPAVAEQPSAAVVDERPKTAKLREPRRDGGLAWLVLAGLLVLAATPLLVEIHRPALWSAEEALTVEMSAETHRRKTPITDGDTSLDAWTPVYEGTSRWDLPPGRVWLDQIMFLGIEANGDGTASAPEPTALITRARIGSVLMVLLFVAGVYWAGYSVGGNLTGTISALVAMTMPLIMLFGRHANPQIAAVGWSTLSIAAALWAMRPLRAAPSLARQLIGWLVCGMGLGMATLTAGPIAIPTTMSCTIALAMVCPRRLGHIMGLITSSAVAALLLTPWVLHVHDQDPEIWRVWLNQLTPAIGQAGWLPTLKRMGWRLVLAAALCGPWLIWLVPAVIQPFSTSTGKARRKMLLGWVWLITASTLLAIMYSQTELPNLLMILAPASIAIGLVVHEFHDRSAEARHARLWRISRWLSCGVMAVLSVALPTLGYLINHQPDLVAWLPAAERPLLGTSHWSFYAGTVVALLLISALAIRFAFAHRPAQTVACLAVWLVIAYAVAAIPIARGPMLSTAVNPPTIELADPAGPQ